MNKTPLATASLLAVSGLALAAAAVENVPVEALIKIEHDRLDRLPDTPSAFFELPRQQAKNMEDAGILRILDDVLDINEQLAPGAADAADAAASFSPGAADQTVTFADVGDVVAREATERALAAEQAKSAELAAALQAVQANADAAANALQVEQAKTTELADALNTANAQLADLAEQLKAAQATFVSSETPASTDELKVAAIDGASATSTVAATAGKATKAKA